MAVTNLSLGPCTVQIQTPGGGNTPVGYTEGGVTFSYEEDHYDINHGLTHGEVAIDDLVTARVVEVDVGVLNVNDLSLIALIFSTITEHGVSIYGGYEALSNWDAGRAFYAKHWIFDPMDDVGFANRLRVYRAIPQKGFKFDYTLDSPRVLNLKLRASYDYDYENIGSNVEDDLFRIGIS
tara:strand:+ start:1503 stop:2042 length:540 start_codon:yes stop_codon:yes gene_type:complete